MSKWISVKDRFPEIGRQVLVYILTEGEDYAYEDIRISHLGSDKEWGGYPIITDSKYVTHWQHLPEPPKQIKG
jgi:hypothetical protein